MKDGQQEGEASGHRFNAWVWGIMLLAGLVWSIWSIGSSSVKISDFKPSAWLDGAALNALTKALRLPGQETLETAHAAVRYRTMGDAGLQVALGCPQWMFYADGLRPPAGVTDEPFEARLKLMRHWAHQLRQKNIQLLVVAIPDKGRVEADKLCGLERATVMDARLERWHDTLRTAGIPFVDLRGVMQGQDAPLFFRTDVHMNATGARLAAQGVAAAALPLLGGAKGAQQFTVHPPGKPDVLKGDLLVLSGLMDAPKGWRPDLERVAPQDIEPVRDLGLLDEAAPVEVLLAGSSNGRRSNFAAWLGMGLGREVWNLSMDGGQFSGGFQDALKKSGDWPHTLRLVIWEFSENALSLPLAEREKAELEAIIALPAAW